jgi:Phosphotransferase enzyme family
VDQPADATMAGGYNSAPRKVGDTVVRAAGPWSPNVHALLRHLERAGFSEAPRAISLTDDHAEEVLAFVPGQAGTYPVREAQRSAAALTNMAVTIRRMHDATQGFVAPEPGRWQSRAVLPTEIDCIGHNDLGPYNVVYDGTDVAAIIDWDFAAPSSRAWDLAYAAHRFAPLSTPVTTRAFGWDPLPDQGRRLRIFAEAYGDLIDPAELIDILVVRLAAIAAHIEAGIRDGDPRFDRHRDERHGDSYRADLAYILDYRARWSRS